MSTLADLTTEVIQNLQSWSKNQEAATHLASDVTAADLTIEVGSAESISAGVAEIGDELIYVEAFDQTAKTLTVAPYGRGWSGTTPAIHTTGDRITFNPRLPRSVVKREINKTILAISGPLFTVKSTNIPYVSSQLSYELPEDFIRALKVEWQTVGSTQSWLPVRKYDWDLTADTTAFPSGKSLDLIDPITPGRSVRVTYAADFSEMADGDTLTDAGIPSSASDVIVYGACSRLVGFQDAARLDVSSVAEDYLDEPTPIGSASTLSRYYYQLHTQRLEDEMKKLTRRHQPRVRWTR